MLTVSEPALKQLGSCSLGGNNLKAVGRQYLEISALLFSSVSLIHWQWQLRVRHTWTKYRLKRGHTFPNMFQKAVSSLSTTSLTFSNHCKSFQHTFAHTSATCFRSSVPFSTLFSVTVTSSSRQCTQHEM